ncbi:hypothetical protein ACV1EI_16015, partial [Aeromonas hydrophila]
ATNQIAQTGLSSLPPVIYYSEQLFRVKQFLVARKGAKGRWNGAYMTEKKISVLLITFGFPARYFWQLCE